ncbi:hypothetical protein NDN08_002581 [Rhodosorus marinus]|uniref:Diphthamide biosynthesis protein 4 n=1 Tax=Rhodosorus marinus TaxID=101924 RepID=A0AAV8UYD1_9RHOD|nr:hypothetical protein NDN08_002581 [Rhodosorus marinus]
MVKKVDSDVEEGLQTLQVDSVQEEIETLHVSRINDVRRGSLQGTADVKKAFRSLSLKYHPDRTRSNDAADFQRLRTAYEVISSSELRLEYDAALFQVQQRIVSDELFLSEMEETTVNNARAWCSPCRCGGSYTVTDADLRLGINIVGCDTCSLAIELIDAVK